MSTTIDNRVVEMQFDNKRFEQNVQTSLGTIEKLKQSLNFAGAAKGLESIDTAANGVKMSGLQSAVETVGLKFNAMYTIADQALRNIVNSAMAAGKRVVSALTIDPIKMGFSEYETQINAVQTILANTESKGKTLNDVNAALDELNTYADKTIYNFTEMTRNIGTFTAAGVDLDTSVAAIKGIANLAAVSGSTSQQASTAMYQLSQALASGTVKLMDWNSVVNAGMGGQVFQDALKETARVHGVAIDDLIAKEGSFRETLQHGWLSSEILTETLSKFTGDLTEAQLKSMGYTDEQIKGIIKMGQTANDAATKVKTFSQLFDTLKEAAQSGWTQTWEIIVGDFEEAKAFLTEVSDTIGGIIGSSAEARNEMLENWKVLGGRTALIDSLRNVFEGVMSVVKPIKEAFRDIFPPMTSERLYQLTEGLKNLTAKLKLSDGTSDKLKRTFKGLFAIIDIIRQVFVAVVKAAGSLFGTVGKLGGGILGVTASFGDWLVKLNESIKKSDIFNKALQGVVKAIKFVFSGIELLITGIKKLFKPMGEAFSDLGDGVSSAMQSVSSSFENWSIFKILKGLWNAVKIIAKGIGKVLSGLGEYLGEKLGGGNFEGVLNLIKTVITGGVGVSLMKFIKSLTGSFDGISDVIENFSGIFEGLGGVLEGYQSKLKAEALVKIATAIAILAGSVLILSFVDSEKLYESIVGLGLLFAELTGAMALLNKTGDGAIGAKRMGSTMVMLAASVLVLALALKSISNIEPDKMVTGIVGIAALVGIIVGAVKLIGTGGKKMMKGATQLVIFAAAIKVLASACKDLSVLSWEELAKGLVGVGVLMAEVSLFLNTAKFSAKSILTATGIVILSAAIKVLASACADFGRMQWGEIGKGLTAIALLLAEIVIFTKLSGNAKHVISTGIALIAIAAAMKIFASATQMMASMSWKEIAKGLVAMAGALAAVVIAVNLMPKNLVSKGVGLIAISAALLILSSTLTKLGGMSWESIGKSLVSLGGSMLILAIGLHAMNGTVGGSASLIVAALALAIFTPVMKSLGSMNWGSIAKGLLTIAGVFVILGVAGYALAPVVPVIVSLAGAIALIGLGALAFGAGMIAFGTGLTSLSAGFVAVIAAIGGSIDLLIELIVAFVVGICEGVAEGIVAICRVIADGVPAIGEALIALVLTLCEVLVKCAPVIADTLLNLIASVLEALVKYTPRIVDALFNFIIGILEGLARNMPRLIQSVLELIMSLFTGVIDALGSLDFGTIVKGMAGIGLIAGVIAALSAITPLIPGAMVGVLGVGAVIAELALVLAAIGALAQIPGLKWLIDEGGELLKGIGNALGGLIGGLIGGIAEGITASLPQIGTDLSNFMKNAQPFLDGAKSIDSSVLDGVFSLVDVVLAITGAKVLDRLASWLVGGSSIVKFGEDLAEFGPYMKSYADSISGVDPSVVEASANAAKALAKMCSYIPNSGGIVSWFAGDNSVSKFGEELPKLGEGLKSFSNSINGINPENITAASQAAKSLAEMCSTIPNSGGVVSWFAGDNSVSKFGKELPKLGEGLKGFSDSLGNVVPENITAAADAAKTLAEMCSTIPDSGGMVSWFAGDNSVSKFGKELKKLGEGLKGFADSFSGANTENIKIGADAAKSLAEMASIIPNSGGIGAWFSGDNSVSKFGKELKNLGEGLKGFSDSLVGIVPENMTAGVNAAKGLAEIAAIIPNSGGIGAWFAGDNSVSKFGNDLKKLGEGLKGFSDATVGIIPENLTVGVNAAKGLAEIAAIIPNSGGIGAWFAGDNSVSKFGGDLVSLGKGLKGFSDSVMGIVPENLTAGVNAAKGLAEMAAIIPNSGGIGAWFAGDNSVSKFGGDLVSLGKGIKGFSDSVMGIVPENMTAGVNAAKGLAEMATIIPNSGGVVSWFAGDNSISKFGGDLASLGKGLKGFSDSITGIVPENMTAAANAAKALAEMANTVPNSGGIAAWFTGDNSIAKFGDKLPQLGKGLKGFSDSVAGIVPENIMAAADAGKKLAEIANTAPENVERLPTFGAAAALFGDALSMYFSKVRGITKESISASSNAIEAIKKISGVNLDNLPATATGITKLSEAMHDLSKVKADSATGFKKAVDELSKTNIDGMIKNIDGAEAKMKNSGKKIIDAFVNAINGSKAEVTTAGKDVSDALIKGAESKSKSIASSFSKLVDGSITALTNKYQSFYSAGSYLAEGFAAGISANSFKASARAAAMASVAIASAKKVLDINSPSKVFKAIGSSIPEGFAIGIGSLGKLVMDSTISMSDSAIDGVKKSIAHISDLVNGDIDAQPTIRPVLDLTNVKSGASAINGMLAMDHSIGVMANVGAISSMMSVRNQNGETSEMVSAIDKLRKDIRDTPRNVTNVNGITYDDGSNVADAVRTLVRAARVERRK